MEERKSPGGKKESWGQFTKRNSAFADAARSFLLDSAGSLPQGVPHPPAQMVNEYQNKQVQWRVYRQLVTLKRKVKTPNKGLF